MKSPLEALIERRDSQDETIAQEIAPFHNAMLRAFPNGRSLMRVARGPVRVQMTPDRVLRVEYVMAHTDDRLATFNRTMVLPFYIPLDHFEQGEAAIASFLRSEEGNRLRLNREAQEKQTYLRAQP